MKATSTFNGGNPFFTYKARVTWIFIYVYCKDNLSLKMCSKHITTLSIFILLEQSSRMRIQSDKLLGLRKKEW